MAIPARARPRAFRIPTLQHGQNSAVRALARAIAQPALKPLLFLPRGVLPAHAGRAVRAPARHRRKAAQPENSATVKTALRFFGLAVWDIRCAQTPKQRPQKGRVRKMTANQTPTISKYYCPKYGTLFIKICKKQ